MLKNVILLLAFIAVVKSHAQVSTGTVGVVGAESDGIQLLVDLNCMGEPCLDEGETFLLPFTIETESDLSTVEIADLEIFLAQTINADFENNVGVFNYGGGLRFLGFQSQAIVSDISEKIMKIKVVETQFIADLGIGDNGKRRIQFQLSGYLGASKMQKLQTLSPEKMEYIYQELGLQNDETIDNGIGSSVGVSAQIDIQLNKLTISNYYALERNQTNSFLGSSRQNAFGNRTAYGLNSHIFGIEASYPVYSGRRGDLFVFGGIEYGIFRHSIINNSKSVMASHKKDLTFKIGIRYIFPHRR